MTTNLKGIFIPIEILLDENLSLQEKLVLSLVKIMPDALTMSNARIGELINLSKSRVSEICSSLANKGYIEIKLIYKPNSKQVDERRITLTEAIKKVQEVVAAIKSKAKEIKQEFVQENTKKAPSYTHNKNFYNYKKKETVFNRTYSHNWDLDELERIDRQHLEEKYRERCKDEICAKG